MSDHPPISPGTGLAGHVLFTFWTGSEPMSAQRCASIKQLKTVTECEVILVTASELPQWILPHAPLHEAYAYLSAVHRADYLRSYFMHHYGGGYADVKPARGSWKPAFAHIETQPDCWVVGYPELSPDSVANVPDRKLYEELRRCYTRLPGNGAYVCRPNTALTAAWTARVHTILDEKAERLRAYPAPHARASQQEDPRYAIRWTEICGDVFHPLCLTHLDRIATKLAPLDFSNYQ
jgi:hypothetical protein